MKRLLVVALLSSLIIFWFSHREQQLSSSPSLFSDFGKETYSATDTVEILQQNATTTASSSALLASSTLPVITHIATPEHVKAIYMSSWVAGTPSVRERLIKLIEDTELNAVVIDVKDNTGALSWDGRVRDMDELITELHDKHIYVIARIASFQDPLYVKKHPELAVKSVKTGEVWRDHKGVPWIDTGSQEMWSYLAKIGQEAYERGFDELNYDYIRFPTDGDLKSMRFPISGEKGLTGKREIVGAFYKFLHETFSPQRIPISGDLFGIIATNQNETKTLGQDLRDALMYFDYVALMVYPSHFYAGTAGYQNPAAHPGPIISYSTQGALTIIEGMTATSSLVSLSTSPLATSTLIAKLRPWYQDFDMGATYTKEMVRAQITAGEKYGVNSWMLWDPANKYTKDALLK